MDTAEKKWIAFDAAGTLFETAEPVEKVYAERFSSHGFALPEATWKKAFRQAFTITPDPIYPDAGDGEEVERKWWRDLVGCAAESTGISPDPETMDKAFGELFDHYAAGSAWKLFPETESTLTSLKSKGIGLAVTSNFDFRIHRVLRELGISEHFDLVLTSADVRARKPSPHILRKLLLETDSSPSNCCLTGDSLHADKGAAKAAGIGFFHIDRPTADLTDFEQWHAATFFPK
jgi:REG-2-like HAD superfamily hydrolase